MFLIQQPGLELTRLKFQLSHTHENYIVFVVIFWFKHETFLWPNQCLVKKNIVYNKFWVNKILDPTNFGFWVKFFLECT